LDIEQDHIRIPALKGGARICKGGHPVHLIPLAGKVMADKPQAILFIIDN